MGRSGGINMKNRVLIIISMILISTVSFIGGTKTNTENHLNMETVIDFEATETGLMLYTNDGNGYYLEK